MLAIRSILFARDFSPCSDQALPLALALADRMGAHLHMLFVEVLHGDPFMPPAYPAQSPEALRERVQEAFKAPLPADFDPSSLSVEHAVTRGIAAAPAILDYAAEHDVDLIVMGTHGRRGLRRFLIGSVAEEVVRLSTCPVLTVRQRSEESVQGPIHSMLVPVDFSEHSVTALRHAKALSRVFDADIDLLHVLEEPLHPAFYNPSLQSVFDQNPDLERNALADLERLDTDTGPAGGTVTHTVLLRHPARQIVHHAIEQRHDLIVIGTHGLTGLERFFLGSVTEKVVRRAPCPVFALKSFGRSLLKENTAEQAALSGIEE